MSGSTQQVTIDWAGREVQIECQWHLPGRRERPLLVFLHEGLGSVSMWRDFPAALCEAADMRGLVYSRPGYGRSSPRPAGERWRLDFMHRQADEVLPALLRALDIRERPFLFGHSDGGSIALLFAAHFPQALAGAIVVAPHILVEEFGLASIRKARGAYLTAGLKERLARHHQDVDSAFYGWNDIWLDAAFEAWNIEEELPAIRCPLLAVQGLDDEYGTLEQIRGIARRVPQTRLLEIAACGHSPHRDQPQALIEGATRFLREHESGTMASPSFGS
jgi:pimeloyl-ACP methyl ester carboxylesterase